MLVCGWAVMADSARASYLVVTQATAYVEFVNSTLEYAYNYAPLGTGYQAVNGCQINSTCTGSATTDTVGNLKASVDQTSVIGNNPNPAGYATASAYAAASLYQGAVRVQAAGTYLDYMSPSSGQAGGTGKNYASIGDTLHFNIPGATSSTVTDIGVTFTIDGAITVTTASGDSAGTLNSIFGLGSAVYDDSITTAPSYTPVMGSPTATGWVSSSWSSRTPGLIVFNGIYAVTGSNPTVPIGATIYENGCGLGTSCDYSNTAAISFNLPTGVTFTSDSGVFLTQPAGGAPEPASTALLATGLACVVLLRRRKPQ